MTRRIKILFLILSCVLLAIFTALFSRKARTSIQSPIVITEVCADNSHAAYDDNANYDADFIELYNRSDSPINLQGWALSDDPSALRKFVFPDFTIDPGQAVIAWCSPNIDDVSCYDESYVPIDIHDIPFSLSPAERCILTTAERKTASEVLIPTGIPNGCTFSTSLDAISSSDSNSTDGFSEYYPSLPTPRII
ncbi:MAG: lamin tail domain-containing protein [Butyrivibrio sp.]|nr:lamin tail domain-containing protein [Butyrivibrio sp.]